MTVSALLSTQSKTTSRADRTDSSSTVVFSSAAATVTPSGNNDTPFTAADACTVASTATVATSTKTTLPLLADAANTLPSGDNDTLVTLPFTGNVARGAPVAESHSRSVPSLLPVAISPPGTNSTHSTLFLWPTRSCSDGRHARSAMSYTLVCAGVRTASAVPSGK